jgi:hypothetical protein
VLRPFGPLQGLRLSRATVRQLWASGLDDVRRTRAHPELVKGTEFGHGVRVYDLAR